MLFIVNAPKTETPKYINYDDICYSQPGPRKPQVFLTHILPWNLLLVASANSIELGVLGTTEQGDFPTWKQFVFTELRPELPLNSSKQETFPLGMSLELGVTHQLTINETTFPVMPMIHLLSTDGLLISFNLLNTMSNVPGICFPPNPIRNNTGLVYFKVPDVNVTAPVAQKPALESNKADISFALGNQNATSTPTQMNAKSLFGNTGEPPKSASNLFGTLPTAKPPVFGTPQASTGFNFGGLGSNQPTSTGPIVTEKPPPSFGSLTHSTGPKAVTLGFGSTPVSTSATPTDQRSSVSSFGQQIASPSSANDNKPLITVPPTYTAATKPVVKTSAQTASNTSVNSAISGDQTEEAKIVQAMIREEIQNFQKDLRELISRSKTIHINIGTREESADMAKQLNELSKLNKEATEVNDSLASDVHSLRLNLNETFAMVTEAKNKNKLYTSQNHLQMQDQYSMSQTSKRHLARLETMLKMNEAHLYTVTRQLDAQWADYQDMQKQKTRNTMKIPSLEGVYQAISKQRDILAKHRSNLNRLKTKIGMRDTVRALESTKQDPVESLTDSILSMSIIDQVQRENEKLNPRKLELLRECLKRHRTKIVKPNRPDRLGLNSEVVQEKREQVKKVIEKLKTDKKIEKEPPKVAKPREVQKPFMPPMMSQPTQKTAEAQKFVKPPKPEPKFEIPKQQTTQNTKPTIPTFAAPTNVPMTKPIAQKPPTQPSSGFAFAGGASGMTQSETPKFSFAQLTPQVPPAQFGSLSNSSSATSTMPFSTRYEFFNFSFNF